jgi:hypothetical protein
MTGNKPQSDLSGEHLLLLVYYKMIWPKASYFECIAFITKQSRKVTSTVAYQALAKRNLFRH